MNRRALLKYSLAAVSAIALSPRLHAEDAELVVGTNVSGPPFAFLRHGTYTGFDLEVWAEVAKGMGRKWRLQPMEFSALIPALQTRNIDVIVSELFIKPERQKVIDFSIPYNRSGLIAVAQMDNAKINGVDDLAGKTIGAVTGSSSIDYIRQHITGATIAQMPSVNDALLALQAGRNDAVVYDMPEMLLYASTAGKGKVKVIHPALEGLDVGLGYQKDSPLVVSGDAQLAAMKSDGRLKALQVKWFGQESL